MKALSVGDIVSFHEKESIERGETIKTVYPVVKFGDLALMCDENWIVDFHSDWKLGEEEIVEIR